MDSNWAKSYQKKFIDEVFGNASHPDFINRIKPIGSLNPRNVLDIYKGDYFARLQEALGENFETVWAVLGDDEFFELSLSYIKNYPSQFRNLGLYGDQFPHFLKTYSLTEKFPFLPELAAFELRFWKVFHSEIFITHFDFSSIEQERLAKSKINFSPNFNIFSWDYSLIDLWEQRADGFDSFEINLNNPQCLVLYRTSKEVQTFLINSKQYQIIDYLLQGKTVEESFEIEDLEASDIQGLFEFFNFSGVIKSLA